MPRPLLLIDRLTAAIGAEIRGVDLTRPLDAPVSEAIYRALIEHQVIFFRRQKLSPDAFIAFAETFGDLAEPHPVYPHVPGFDQIVRLDNDAGRPADTNEWHADLMFRQQPPFLTMLHAQTVPGTGGDTLWSSMYAAYDALPGKMKEMLADLEAIHEIGSFRNQLLQRTGSADAMSEEMAHMGSAVHPVVRRHPVSGRSYLYVSQGFTSHIVGMSKRDSERLLHFLYDHLNRPEFQVRFRWRAGSLAVWDNHVTEHYAVKDYSGRRCMHRLNVVHDRRATSGPSPQLRVAG